MQNGSNVIIIRKRETTKEKIVYKRSTYILQSIISNFIIQQKTYRIEKKMRNVHFCSPMTSMASLISTTHKNG